MPRSTFYLEKSNRDDSLIRKRIRELAFQRKRFGYRRILTLLRREGIMANHKKVYRIYREENLLVHKRKRKRFLKHRTEKVLTATKPNEI